ncbi:unnamed protein product [Closterium sp. NIES-53]
MAAYVGFGCIDSRRGVLSSSCSSGGGGGSSGGGGNGGGGAGRDAATQRGGLGGGQRQQQLRTRETLSVQQLREWYAGRGRSGGAGPCAYVLRTGTCSGEVCGLPHTTQRCFGRLIDAWRTRFPDAVELPRWHDLLLQNVPIFDLDFDAILAAMYALADITEGDCYLRVLPDPGTVAAALGASASAAPGVGTSALSGTAPTESLHTFILDSGASRSFFRDNTTLTPLRRPVAVSLAVGTPPPLVLYELGSSLYTLTTAPPPLSASGQVAASRQVFAAASRSSPTSPPCSCHPLAQETLLWHHCLGHPSLPRLRGMASRALVSGLPRSLPPLPPGPAPTCVPCVEGRQRVAPHSSSFPPTKAPLQPLHMDVKGEVTEVLIDWIRGACRQLSESFGSDLPVLRLHSDRGGEFSSDLLRAFCRLEGIRQTFTLLASPQQNGIAERRIGMVMDVARTSMIHAAAPHFLWPFADQYTAHQINFQPRVSLPETTPTLRWTGKVGDASAFRVWGSRAFVRVTTADKLSSRAVPCVFLGFPRDAPGWQVYHPTSRHVLSSQDVMFDELVSYYRLFPYRTTSPPPPAAVPRTRYSPGRPPHPPGSCPSGVSQVDPAEPVEVAVDTGATRGAETGGAETGGAETGGAETGGAESGGALGVPSRRVPLSPQRLREWYSQRCRGAAGAGAVGGPGGATRATAGARAAGGAAGAGAAGGALGATGGAGATGGGAGAGATGGAAGAGAAGNAVSAVGAGVAIRVSGGAGAAGGGAGAGAVGGAAGAGARAAGGTGTGDPGAEGTGSVFAVLGSPPSPSPPPPFLSPPPVQSQSQLQPVPPLPGPSPYSGPTRGTHSMTQRPSTASQPVPLPSPPASSLPDGPDPESDSLRAASPTVTRFLASAITYPLFESSATYALVAELVDFAAACRLDYATSLVAASASVCPPSVGGECALSTDVLEDRQEDLECFATASPHLVSMVLAPEGDPDALDIPTQRSYAEAIDGEVPPLGANIVSGMWIFRVKRPSGSPPAFKARYVARGFSQRQGVDFFQTFSPTPKMTTLRGSLHEEIWLHRPPSFTRSFPAGTQWSLRRPVYGLRQAPREWHDTLRTTLAALGFAPSTADPSLFLRTNANLPPFYVLVYVDDLVFPTADTKALAHVMSELQKRHTCTDLGELASYLRLRITRDRA